jgi:acyl-CoA synthetase (AMP-forming)/AMP-acid ligase II
MWRHDDLFVRLNSSGFRRYPEDGGVDDVRRELERSGPGSTLLPACPLMHGTGGFTSLECLSEGGRVVTLPSRQFNPVELLDTVVRDQVNGLIIVGDAFAKPILATLDAHPGRWDLTSLVGIISSGVMWSESTKQGLLRHYPGMLLIDAFSSSEAIGMGSSVSSGDSSAQTAQFTLGPEVRVVDADGTTTFRTIDGTRYSVPGDFAEVDEDGTIHLLGRGSVVINTGGEKVYPEEVEEAIKTIGGVADSVVVGIPDDRFGEQIVAVVERDPGAGEESVTEEKVIDLVKTRLAGYKAPRRVHFVPTIGRSPAGKVDYARHKAETLAWADQSPG